MRYEVLIMMVVVGAINVIGRIMAKRAKARLAAEIERVVWPWIAAGKLKPIVDATFPLEQAAKAHAHLEAGEHVGKVVLVV